MFKGNFKNLKVCEEYEYGGLKSKILEIKD
jgi:hypothetical protein